MASNGCGGPAAFPGSQGDESLPTLASLHCCRAPHLPHQARSPHEGTHRQEVTSYSAFWGSCRFRDGVDSWVAPLMLGAWVESQE